MKKQTLKQSKAKYLLGKNTMMKNAKNLLPFLEKVANNGITSDSSIEEIKSARVACCMVVADIYCQLLHAKATELVMSQAQNIRVID